MSERAALCDGKQKVVQAGNEMVGDMSRGQILNMWRREGRCRAARQVT